MFVSADGSQLKLYLHKNTARAAGKSAIKNTFCTKRQRKHSAPDVTPARSENVVFIEISSVCGSTQQQTTLLSVSSNERLHLKQESTITTFRSVTLKA